MSESRSVSFGFPWLVVFVVFKLVGVCAAWSWWWLLLPIVPVLVEIAKYLMR